MLSTFFEGRWLPIESRLGARAAVIACAIVVDWVIRSIGLAVGADFVVLDQGDRTHVTYGAVAFTTLVTAGVGWVILAVLERVTRHAKVIWTTGALAFLALTAVPIATSQGSVATLVFLALMNTATVLVIVPVMRRTTLRREPRRSRSLRDGEADVSSSSVGA